MDSMSGVNPENVAGFKEYGTKLKDGSSVSLSSRKGHTISANYSYSSFCLLN